MIRLANFTMHDQSLPDASGRPCVDIWRSHGFECDPTPRAIIVDESQDTGRTIKERAVKAIDQIADEGFQAIMVGGVTDVMYHAINRAQHHGMRVVIAATPRERDEKGRFVFRFVGYREIIG